MTQTLYVDVICPSCRKTFSVNRNRFKVGRGKFCSKPCSARAQKLKHGHSWGKRHSSTYGSWLAMKQRCLNPNSSKFQKYGGAGITVDHRWMDFCNFLEDMGERPEGKTLDRIDGSKGYSKSNCRWATPAEQQSNLSTNRHVEFNGAKYTIAELAKFLGIRKNTLQYRIDKNWPMEKLAKPTSYRNRETFPQRDA